MVGGTLRRFRPLSWLALIATAALCAVLAAISEEPRRASEWNFYLSAYGMIFVAFGAALRVAAACGRLDAERSHPVSNGG
jgi:hypothetical protein